MGDDCGSVTVEMPIVLPVLFTLILLIAQAAIWLHATHIAQVTASHSLASTRVEKGTAATGEAEARQVLAQLGHGPLRSPHVVVQRGSERAEVDVSGTASSVLPFVQLPVHAQVAGPVERFRPGGGAE